MSGWSQALKTMVGVLLRSPSAMYLTWGPQLVQLYNDAHWPIMCGRHRRTCWTGFSTSSSRWMSALDTAHGRLLAYVDRRADHDVDDAVGNRSTFAERMSGS